MVTSLLFFAAAIAAIMPDGPPPTTITFAISSHTLLGIE
jgi:hypothetical protein